MTDARSVRAVEVAERFADGLADAAELEEARAGAAAVLAERPTADDEQPAFDPAAVAAVRVAALPLGRNEARRCALEAAYAAAGVRALCAAFRAPLAAAVASEQLIHNRLLACIVGPGAAVAVDAAWLTWRGETVRKVAAAIHVERTSEQLPILADALEEAGCGDTILLVHLRGPGPHGHGCFAVEALLRSQ